MTRKEGGQHFLHLLLLLLFLPLLPRSRAQTAESDGYSCWADRAAYPCRTYAFYRAAAPDLVDLAAVGDLFGVSRLMISNASNISSPAAALSPGQSLLVPLTCSCAATDGGGNRSYAGQTYQIKKGDTFYIISTEKFQNLTTYQAVELVNPTLVPTNLTIGVEVVFPIFCQCPNRSSQAAGQQSRTNFFITYVFQPSDTVPSVASKFGADARSLIALNGGGGGGGGRRGGGKIEPFSTVFVPVSKIPVLQQPASLPPSPPSPSCKGRKEAVVVGLAVGLGIVGFMFLTVLLLMGLFRRSFLRERGKSTEEGEGGRVRGRGGEGKGVGKYGFGASLTSDENLMADMVECLDKYRVFQMEELRQATSGFDGKCLIHGSVYRGYMNSGELYAIKKMKWNACQELKILQKVNHANLVKLEGFCIDPEYGTCYLVYEYVDNGSLHSWLHSSSNSKKLDWRTRLSIALDLANGLQYIHEHTWPRVVHKDIKSSNVLLDEKMRAKIANFGLAKSGCNAVTTHIVGTQGYIAPEYLADGLVTTKIDVFAYGVVLLELVSGKEAVNEDGEALWMDVDRVFEGREGKRDGRLLKWMDGVLVEQSCPMESVVNVMTIARACLQRDPSKRPSMVDIVYMLSKADELYIDFSGDGLAVSSTDVVAR